MVIGDVRIFFLRPTFQRKSRKVEKVEKKSEKVEKVEKSRKSREKSKKLTFSKKVDFLEKSRFPWGRGRLVEASSTP